MRELIFLLLSIPLGLFALLGLWSVIDDEWRKFKHGPRLAGSTEVKRKYKGPMATKL